MNIKEIGDVFHCDCGFSWSRGKNGNHNCANGLREKVRQLAAENVGLKKFIQTDCFVGHIEPETFYEEEVTRYVSADGYEPETPATDRIYAGIKADGVEWTEGAEPSEFGRYWVRYETDIGPQYCSAEWMEYNFCASSTTNIHKIWLADHSRSINSLKGITHYTNYLRR